ncbi:MAG TPA: glycosyltransferase [Candidatus Nesterenkonia stercoripullorum]|uniref:4,4'-diaponeurosporenoate glycosyltransferase n=1 Tax=Candidatus Nesterenkonia stercoripullorum TaxID=2838701 RepID=A0A9D1S0W8_9MICC|nr:glycosyltransferase [Candidatus Nesterenkonia stercoripullorum]
MIPAHQEADRIGAAVSSVLRAGAHTDVELHLVVVADACQDATAEIAHAAGATVIRREDRAVGSARSAGFQFGIGRLVHPASDVDAEHLWLATTDADSVVPHDWFARQLLHRRTGADVVLGTVRLEGAASPDLLGEAWNADYARGVAGRTHLHIHGANFAFSASAYAAAGGFRDLSVDEDVDLLSRFRGLPVDIRTAVDMPVQTSRRTAGRAPGGFASTLKSLEV